MRIVRPFVSKGPMKQKLLEAIDAHSNLSKGSSLFTDSCFVLIPCKLGYHIWAAQSKYVTVLIWEKIGLKNSAEDWDVRFINW